MAQIVFSRELQGIIGVWEDGQSLGAKAVSGGWDGPVHNNAFRIYDTSGSRQEAITVCQDAMTSSVSSIPCLSPWFSLETSSLSESSRDELSSVGRANVSYSELSSCVFWTEGYSEQVMKDDYGII